MDGWNAVRSGHYDLVITDVDMPRLDGIELTTLIKRCTPQGLPVAIVSYKDREADRLGTGGRRRLLLTKAAFTTNIVQAVIDLIGSGRTSRHRQRGMLAAERCAGSCPRGRARGSVDYPGWRMPRALPARPA